MLFRIAVKLYSLLLKHENVRTKLYNAMVHSKTDKNYGGVPFH